MTLDHRTVRSRKLALSIAAGVAAVAFAIGGYAIADASSNHGSSARANAAPVIPFQRGQPGSTKVVGQVPSSFRAGAGTIVTGTAADKAKAAALAAYPGGTVNRVVLLSDGNYNVHMIAVNWPHHIFVTQDFKVIGAE